MVLSAGLPNIQLYYCAPHELLSSPSGEMVNVQMTSVLFSCMSVPHLIPVTWSPSKGVAFLIVAPAAHSAPEIGVNVIESGISS